MILTRYVTTCQLLVKQKRWINYQRQSFFVFENAELFQESVLGDRGSPRHRTGRRKQVRQSILCSWHFTLWPFSDPKVSLNNRPYDSFSWKAASRLPLDVDLGSLKSVSSSIDTANGCWSKCHPAVLVWDNWWQTSNLKAECLLFVFPSTSYRSQKLLVAIGAI